jgi:hypothetical protein
LARPLSPSSTPALPFCIEVCLRESKGMMILTVPLTMILSVDHPKQWRLN